MATEDSGSVNSDQVMQWTVTVQADGDELVLPLPDSLLEEVGWKTGDVLQWVKRDDESWMLTKKEQLDNGDS